MTIMTLQEPITGSEQIEDSNDSLNALVQRCRAFNTCDIALKEQNWDNSPEAAMDNLLGGIKRR